MHKTLLLAWNPTRHSTFQPPAGSDSAPRQKVNSDTQQAFLPGSDFRLSGMSLLKALHPTANLPFTHPLVWILKIALGTKRHIP